MRRALRFLVALVFLTLLWLPVEPATAAPAASGSVIPVAAQQTTSNPTAPAGPTLNPQQQAPNKGRQKLAIGVIAALLLVIVYVGHTTRTKRRKARNG